jgi:hypothetical protein
MISFTHPIRRLGGLVAIVSAAVAVAAPMAQAGVDRGIGVAPTPQPVVMPDAIERRVAVAERERVSQLSDAASRVPVANRPGSRDSSPSGTGRELWVDGELLIGVALGVLLALGLMLTARAGRRRLKTS